MKGECENCGYNTEVDEYKGRVYGPPYRLCKICASTRLSESLSAREDTLTQGEIYIMRSLGYIANLLLDAIQGAPE